MNFVLSKKLFRCIEKIEWQMKEDPKSSNSLTHDWFLFFFRYNIFSPTKTETIKKSSVYISHNMSCIHVHKFIIGKDLLWDYFYDRQNTAVEEGEVIKKTIKKFHINIIMFLKKEERNLYLNWSFFRKFHRASGFTEKMVKIRSKLKRTLHKFSFLKTIIT